MVRTEVGYCAQQKYIYQKFFRNKPSAVLAACGPHGCGSLHIHPVVLHRPGAVPPTSR
jgi:hypothetical protein